MPRTIGSLTGSSGLAPSAVSLKHELPDQNVLGLPEQRLSYLDQAPSFVFTVTIRDALSGRRAPLTGATTPPEEEFALTRPGETPLTGFMGRPINQAPWVYELTESIQAFLSLPYNWNSYGAPEISEQAARTAFELALQIDAPAHLQPAVIPTQSGGVQFEWHAGKIDLEVEMTAVGTVDLWYSDEQGETEREEASLSVHDAALELSALLAVVGSRTA